ncbi:MAG: acetyl/propionyl/methylcrotonyl-CoA carboxylase subunit alpha [Sphingomonadales bacterium]|nr:MAG: acetyl/propionyl/methylcrotonyl-CoA carboxylase subunit alpha [Sphingomonadales bacterium]
MLRKILIANRGEIACRVIRTARKLGIKTVAVYSDADAAALHVEMADEAVHLGPPPAAESYLLGEKIIAACRRTGADAVHPGYGFLSEREWFAKACADNGITFIGPPPGAIAAMGDKIESKKLARAAGVSVVPGFVGEITDTDHAVRIADDIGYPVMMKASAGGGGKGMRLAYSAKDVRETFENVRAEARASFGDDRVFIEKFVVEPRHIEIQVLGDQQGNIVYLGERDCSIQRRHQKVVEEAPSPFVTPEMRQAMGEQAVALSRAVGYFSAGTVEFIVGKDRSFYFLEMNTRLQVEHPVTEMITGLDLVEQMIRVASGEPLGFTQAQVKLNGWAMESRLYAEDPYRGFLPSIGRLTRYREPQPVTTPDANIRVDAGVVEGSEISMFYDPMIAKLITWAPTRDAAADLQLDALDRYVVQGIRHNRDFLAAVMQHPRFRAGGATTAFIGEEYPEGFTGTPLTPALASRMAVAACLMADIANKYAQRIEGQLNGHGAEFGPEWIAVIDGTAHAVRIEGRTARIGEETYAVETDWRPGQMLFSATMNGAPFAAEVERLSRGYRLTVRGLSRAIAVHTPRAHGLAQHMIEKTPPDLSRQLRCPMPGLVVSIDAAEGDMVEAGQPLAVVEAMKMQNILRAEKKARIKAVHAAAGQSLAVDEVILEFE